MTTSTSFPVCTPRERILDRLDTGRSGPTVLLCGGVHGNEPDGVAASRRVLDVLRRHETHVRGRVLAVVGNVAALGGGMRYVTEDLNRMWSDARVARIEGQPAAGRGIEEAELLALLEVMRGEVERLLHPAAESEPWPLRSRSARERGVASTRLTFVDLHSTSGDGPPFAILGDTLRNRRVGFALEVPVILGLEEAIDGTLLEFLSDRGHVALCIEGGRSRAEATVENLVSAGMLALDAAGCFLDASPFDLPAHRERLRQRVEGLPRFVEIRHRERLEDDQGFAMRDGFRHFQKVRRGQPLAYDREGAITSPESGFVLMPRYQGQGNDGFFVARRVRRIWLMLSRALRTLRLDRLVTWLPGVRRDPEHEQAVLVSHRVARFYTTQVFHLLGYRRERSRGALLVFSRRRPTHLPALPLTVQE